MTFAVRSSRAGTQAFLKEVEEAVSSVNGDLPVAAPLTMQEIYSKSLARTSFTLLMLELPPRWRSPSASSASTV